jgi:abortive infection bacteriophage resistance protein
MAVYPKPFKNIPDLLALLQQRGMLIQDVATAARCMDRVGYYRLSGYWYPMRKSHVNHNQKIVVEEDFRQNTTFSQVADLYVFDKKLRLLMLDAIERVEVGLKIKVAEILGQQSPLAHLESSQLHGNFSRKDGVGPTNHEKWIQNYRRCEQRSKEDFIKPFLANHSGHEFPIWMAIELWDFGNLSHFLPGLKFNDAVALANAFGIPRVELMISWVRAIHTVRNTCAHHSRLWNRPLADNPKPPKLGEEVLLDHLATDTHAQTRLYCVAAALQYFLRQMHSQSSWAERLKAHALTMPNGPNLSFSVGAGFPVGWENLPLWN